MSLARLKLSLKLLILSIFLALFATAFFWLGKSSNNTDETDIKGTATINQTFDSPIESPIPAADTQTATITASSVKLCANTVFSFELSYPKEWFTTYNIENERCQFFAPYSFILPYETSNFLIPIRLEVTKPEDWLGNVKFHENPNDFQNVVTSQTLEIDGKSAKKIEATSTGQDSIPRSFVKITYLIFNAEFPIIVRYQQIEAEEDVEANKKVLEEIVTSIRFF